jgi:N-methylhydantoinase B/oxoprolinase/acetone carboxylase alpha subunit
VITTLPGQEQPVALGIYGQNLRFRPAGFAGGLPSSLAGYVRNGEPLGPDSPEVIESFLYLNPGDELAIRFAGGAGYGDPSERSEEAIRADLDNEFVSAEAARDYYGLDQRAATTT